MEQNNTGKFIKELREKHKLTQQELADIIPVTREAVSKWERGISLPDSDCLVKLSTLFKVSINEILDGEYKVNKKLIIAYIVIFIFSSFIFNKFFIFDQIVNSLFFVYFVLLLFNNDKLDRIIYWILTGLIFLLIVRMVAIWIYFPLNGYTFSKLNLYSNIVRVVLEFYVLGNLLGLCKKKEIVMILFTIIYIICVVVIEIVNIISFKYLVGDIVVKIISTLLELVLNVIIILYSFNFKKIDKIKLVNVKER